jgi:hypothetical protein
MKQAYAQFYKPKSYESDEESRHLLAVSGPREEMSPHDLTAIETGILSTAPDTYAVQTVVYKSKHNSVTVVSVDKGFLIHEETITDFQGDDNDVLIHSWDIQKYLDSIFIEQAA